MLDNIQEIDADMELLADPVIQTILAFLAVIIPVVTYFKKRKIKSLGYMINPIIPLSNVDPQLLGSYKQIGLKFMFNDIVLEKAHFIHITIKNIGNLEIERKDFDEPISLIFGEKTKILGWRPLPISPGHLDVKLNVKNHEILIDPILLNEKDEFIVEVLVTEFDGVIIPKIRISGIKEFKHIEDSESNREEELITESILTNLLLLVFAIAYNASFLIGALIGVLILQCWRIKNIFSKPKVVNC